MNTEFYEFLGVKSDANSIEIKRAYFKKALQYHPDKNIDNKEEAKEKFQRLQKIYSTLSVPSKREDYDRFGEVSDDEEELSAEENNEEVAKIFTVEELLELMESIKKEKIKQGDAEKLKADVDFVEKLPALGVYNDETLSEVLRIAASDKISVLGLSRKQIKEIPSVIGSIKSLETLVMRENKISHLPNEFAHLELLTILDFGGNQFVEIPDVIFSLTKLKEINFEHNKINKISNAIGQLKNLQVINLFKNNITDVPWEITTLKKLKRVDLAINFIKKYPEELLTMKIDLIIDEVPAKPKKKESDSTRPQGKK